MQEPQSGVSSRFKSYVAVVTYCVFSPVMTWANKLLWLRLGEVPTLMWSVQQLTVFFLTRFLLLSRHRGRNPSSRPQNEIRNKNDEDEDARVFSSRIDKQQDSSNSAKALMIHHSGPSMIELQSPSFKGDTRGAAVNADFGNDVGRYPDRYDLQRNDVKYTAPTEDEVRTHIRDKYWWIDRSERDRRQENCKFINPCYLQNSTCGTALRNSDMNSATANHLAATFNEGNEHVRCNPAGESGTPTFETELSKFNGPRERSPIGLTSVDVDARKPSCGNAKYGFYETVHHARSSSVSTNGNGNSKCNCSVHYRRHPAHCSADNNDSVNNLSSKKNMDDAVDPCTHERKSSRAVLLFQWFHPSRIIHSLVCNWDIVASFYTWCKKQGLHAVICRVYGNLKDIIPAWSDVHYLRSDEDSIQDLLNPRKVADVFSLRNIRVHGLFFPLSLTFTLQILFCNVCLNCVFVSTYQVARSTGVIFNAFLPRVIGHKSGSLSKAEGACLVIACGVAVGLLDSSSLSWQGVVFGLAASIFGALYMEGCKMYMKKMIDIANSKKHEMRVMSVTEGDKQGFRCHVLRFESCPSLSLRERFSLASQGHLDSNIDEEVAGVVLVTFVALQSSMMFLLLGCWRGELFEVAKLFQQHQIESSSTFGTAAVIQWSMFTTGMLLLSSAVIATVLPVATATALLCFSPSALSVVGHAKTAMQTIGGFVIFGEGLNVKQGGGILLTIFGCGIYYRAK
eukprot:Lankesteria_metandrocarpae@DN4083_c0_g1_i1.p1